MIGHVSTCGEPMQPCNVNARYQHQLAWLLSWMPLKADLQESANSLWSSWRTLLCHYTHWEKRISWHLLSMFLGLGTAETISKTRFQALPVLSWINRELWEFEAWTIHQGGCWAGEQPSRSDLSSGFARRHSHFSSTGLLLPVHARTSIYETVYDKSQRSYIAKTLLSGRVGD